MINMGKNIEHTTPAANIQTSPDNSYAILSYLKKLDVSNQALIKRVCDLEVNESLPSTPSPWSQSDTGHSLIMHQSVSQGHLSDPRITFPVTRSMSTQSTPVRSNSAGQIQHTQAQQVHWRETTNPFTMVQMVS